MKSILLFVYRLFEFLEINHENRADETEGS
jgi:hypothetical protein